MKALPQDGVVVVTGAGGGLGRALAQVLVREGYTVAGLSRDGEGPEGVRGFAVDVAQPEAVARGFAEIRAALGPVSVLVNNAAVYPRRDLLDEDGESFAATVAVNLGGVVSCTRAALDDMVVRGQGRVLNVATFADLNPLPCSAAYSVSKGAARIFTRAVIADIADRFPGIVVSDWMPGMLATRMGVPDGVSPEVAAEWGARLALSRDPALTGSVFEMDCEVLSPRGLKRRVRDALLLQRRRARRVSEL